MIYCFNTGVSEIVSSNGIVYETSSCNVFCRPMYDFIPTIPDTYILVARTAHTGLLSQLVCAAPTLYLDSFEKITLLSLEILIHNHFLNMDLTLGIRIFIGRQFPKWIFIFLDFSYLYVVVPEYIVVEDIITNCDIKIVKISRVDFWSDFTLASVPVLGAFHYKLVQITPYQFP